ncbi:MAG: stage IV sporulation protein A [Clostridiales bacterium]|jgi:stage IV sporulation protein A|nr:stage IV sporulation protein A [Clostridiales bacterium]
MENFNLYKDIAERTQGDIYIGVVGPVRTGKSTFIKRFMDLMVIPKITNGYIKERAKDELPQSSAGKAIMTTEPKFVPNEAVEVSIDDALNFKMRMIDCVGYLVPDAIGYMDGESPRMVNTPWSENRIPFVEAAETGTRKVIADHSTIGVVVTTDGSVTEIERSGYEEAEERVINELKELDKPFVVALNTAHPYAPETETLRAALAARHNVPVVSVNCAQLKEEDINLIMEKALYEFPVKEIKISFPRWLDTLDFNHWLKQDVISSVRNMMGKASKLRDVKDCIPLIEENSHIKKAYLDGITLGEGCAGIEVSLDDSLFYKVLSETIDMDIDGEHQLISTIKVLAEAKKEYDKVRSAIEEVRQRGYGIVTPALDEMKLEAPVIVKNGARFGVKIKATAPSIHLMRADIETEISPIVGTEKQSEDLINYLLAEMAEDPNKVWELNMFGRSMHDLVRDGLQSKLYRIPEDARMKFQETLQRIINEGSGGLICIIL